MTNHTPEYRRWWYEKNPDKQKIYSQRYYLRHRKQCLERARKKRVGKGAPQVRIWEEKMIAKLGKENYWKYRRNKEDQWHKAHRLERNIQAKQRRKKRKLEVLGRYSGINPPQCADIFGEHEKPYTNIDALSIDHIAGGGTKHTHSVANGNFYSWLKRNGFPAGYQVLCMNCQYIKRARNEEYGNKWKRVDV